MTGALFFAILQPVVAVVLFVWLWKVRSTLSRIRLDPDTVDAACLRVALRWFRNILLCVVALWVLQAGRLLFLVLE